MESRIRVAVDFKNGNSPVIHIAKKSGTPGDSDVRDDLLGAFIESFPSWNNRWCKVLYQGEDLSEGVKGQTLHYHIAPITEKDIQEEIKLMQAYLEQLQKEKGQSSQA